MKPIFKPGTMNKTEAAFAEHIERAKLIDNDIVAYVFEPLKLRLAKNTFYTPDFLVVRKSCFEIFEVKGFWRDDARVKIKVAAKMFPWFKWYAVQLKKKQWTYEEF